MNIIGGEKLFYDIITCRAHTVDILHIIEVFNVFDPFINSFEHVRRKLSKHLIISFVVDNNPMCITTHTVINILNT